MPSIRKLYTLLDVKQLIANKEKCPIDEVNIYECKEMVIDDGCGGNYGVENDTFLFQVDAD